MKHRLLIPDPYTPQSYDVINQLRDTCEYCVATIPFLGKRSALFCFSAYSRFVNKRYHINHPRDATMMEVAYSDECREEERSYVDQIIALCEKERIDLVYPTDDYEVLLLSKYKRLFEERSIELPVNKFQTLVQLFDKQKAIAFVSAAGVSCPGSWVLDEACIRQISEETFRERKIIKPRFSSAARGVYVVHSQKEFDAWFKKNGSTASCNVLQEYIPGNTMLYYRMYFDSQGVCVHSSCAQALRPEMLVYQSRGLLLENIRAPECITPLECFFQKLDYRGYVHAQFKIDQRTGKPIFLETNPRISRGTWTEMYSGINGPQLSRELLQGIRTNIVSSALEGPAYVFVWPIQDLIILFDVLAKKAVRRLGRMFFYGDSETCDIIPSVSSIVLHYQTIYFKRKKKYNFFVKNFLCDPIAGLFYWSSFLYTYTKSFKSR